MGHPSSVFRFACRAAAWCVAAWVNGAVLAASSTESDAAWLESARPVAEKIVASVRSGHDGYRKLEELCDDIGHRLSGSEGLDKAVAWAVARLRADGHENVRAEPVMVPRWVRGRESAEMLEPQRRPLAMLGLGGSVGTPPSGLRGEVVVVRDEAELERLGTRAEGKIVLFNNPMPPYDRERGSGYGETVRFRGKGATLAAQKGGVACLIRSVTATSLSTPHTGAMNYDDATRRVPAAALSIEDAEQIARLTARGKRVVVELRMEAHDAGMAPSANVVAELRGRTHPDEIVVIGGHLDSWDVGHGAHDDGAGSVICMEALNVLRRLELFPRRTIRVVLFTNEENGLGGAKQYVKDHASEMSRHVAAIETDSGAFRPEGFSVDFQDDAREPAAAARLRPIGQTLLGSLGASKVSTGHGGADVSQLRKLGVPTFGQDMEGSRYFDFHHTHADTLDKVDPQDLSDCIASMAIMAYSLADMPVPIGHSPEVGGTR